MENLVVIKLRGDILISPSLRVCTPSIVLITLRPFNDPKGHMVSKPVGHPMLFLTNCVVRLVHLLGFSEKIFVELK